MTEALALRPDLPERRMWLWRIFFPIVRGLAVFLCPLRVEGLERLPRTGGYILVANHVNWKDPPWIEFAIGHAIRYMAKQEVFEMPIVGWALRAAGNFPVRRGESDRRALAMAMRVLAAGQPLGFFPEGHRSEDGALLRARPGIGFIARRGGVPLVPVAVRGTPRARLGRFWRRDVAITIGEPFDLDALGVPLDDPQAVADAIMRRLAAYLPPELRGFYA